MAKALLIEHAPDRAAGFDYFLEKSSVDFVVVRTYEQQPLPSLDGYDAIIPAGGPMGVYEINKPEYSFLKEECDYLSEAIQRDVPILGVCLGHQLLAHVLGGVVAPSDTPEIGWMKITLTQEGLSDPLFAGFDQDFFCFQYHVDAITEMPEDTTRLAESPASPVQAFRYRDKAVWGIQFHPEILPSMSEPILSSRRRVLEKKGIDVDSEIAKGYKVYSKHNEMLFQNFFRYVRLNCGVRLGQGEMRDGQT